jgi:hypothetical protein
MSKIEIQNVLQPGKTYRVDGEKFSEVHKAVLKVLPAAPPGMTPRELIDRVKPLLSPAVFPGGEKAGWWVKSVQLDLEAKGTICRADTAPVRLWKVRAQDRDARSQ